MYFLGMVMSFIVSILCARIFIPKLIKLKFGQTVREDGPQSHVVKNGTPTMGGIIFIAAIFVVSLILLKKELSIMYPVISLVLFSCVGFADDFLKIARGKNLGLTAKEKMIALIVVSFTLSFMAKSLYGSEIIIPFMKTKLDLGVMYIPFMMLVYVGASNAVNLTDGLDGLATSVTIVVTFFIGILSYIMGGFGIFNLTGIIIGALVGFLLFNMNPAKVFMGDTGSLGLGGMLVALVAQIQLPLILLVVGIIYIIETLSVIIQVISFKTTGKRVFKMSPIHHHFEMEGLSENRIAVTFSIISVLFGILAILAI